MFLNFFASVHAVKATENPVWFKINVTVEMYTFLTFPPDTSIRMNSVSVEVDVKMEFFKCDFELRRHLVDNI